jgi:hypothetical protein
VLLELAHIDLVPIGASSASVDPTRLMSGRMCRTCLSPFDREETLPQGIQVLEDHSLLDHFVALVSLVIRVREIAEDRAGVDPTSIRKSVRPTCSRSRLLCAQKQPCEFRYSGVVTGCITNVPKGGIETISLARRTRHRAIIRSGSWRR